MNHTDCGSSPQSDDSSPHSTETTPRCGRLLVSKLLRARWCVLICWSCALVASAPFAAKLIDAARFNFKPVPGTQSYEAQMRIKTDFPHLTYQDIEVVLLSCANCPLGVVADNTQTGNFTRHAIDAMRSKLNALARRHPDLRFSNMSALDYANSHFGAFSPRNPLLSRDNLTAIFQFSWEVRPDQQKQALVTFQDFADSVDRLQDEADQTMSGYNLALTGPLALFKTSLDSTRKDLISKDLFVVPVTLLILCWRVRSWRLTLLTLINVGVSVAVSFALFLPVATYAVDISPIVPSVMVFLSIALSIDYSLFLFTRFVEEINNDKPPRDALEPMLLHSGEVVCLSGSVLILCYMGVLLFPGAAISSVGLGASFSISMSMAANLTISPCAIAAFPHFFGSGLTLADAWRCGCAGRQRESRQHSAWFRWGRKVTTWPCTLFVPLVAYGMMAPLCLHLLSYKESFNNQLMFPSTGRAADAYKRVHDISAPGALAPIFIMQRGNVKSNDWFAENCNWAARLMRVTAGHPYELHARDFLGISVLPNPLDSAELLNLNWNASKSMLSAEYLLHNPVIIQGHDIGAAYRLLWDQMVSFKNDTGMLRIQPSFDPYGPNMRPLINALREELDRDDAEIIEDTASHAQIITTSYAGILPQGSTAWLRTLQQSLRYSRDEEKPRRVYLYSPLVIVFDIMRVTYNRLPYVLAVVFGTCFLSIGLVFRAAFVPLKLCFTVLVPLCAVYGTAVLVYQDGILDFMHWRPLEGTGGIYWAQPVFTVTILTGLALDYDIFLFARVVELRLKGFSNPAAVAGAMALTGPTITAAGLIMASAFGGLLLTDIPANNQIGFLMSFAVLMDTFIIRTCLVPAVLVLASKLNYWPRKLPAESKAISDMQEMVCQTAAD